MQINEMEDIPEKTRALIRDLKGAVPFKMMVLRNVRMKLRDTFRKNHEIVSDIHFTGESGGIMVELKPNEIFEGPRLVSITMLEMQHRHPLRKRVNKYRRDRIGTAQVGDGMRVLSAFPEEEEIREVYLP